MRPTSVLVPTLLLALVSIAALAAPPAGGPRTTVREVPRFELETCRVPNLDEDVRCGTFEVFENRAAKSGRKIGLNVVVLPASGEDPRPDPVFYFAGGPGGAATEYAAELATFLADVRRRHDLVLVDQRGTGRSNPLKCPYQDRERGIELALESFLPTELIEECRPLLERTSDLTQYTTAHAVDDFEEVRGALGYGKINLMGGSYGTTVALEYMRRHPQAVRTAVIEGVVPFNSHAPLTFARDAQAALDGVFEECAAEAPCHEAFPDPKADLDTVLRRLDEGPVEVSVIDPRTQKSKPLRISRNVFVQSLRYMLYQVLGAVQIPLFLHEAAAGNFEPLGQVAFSVAGGLLNGFPDGLYLSVTCSEDVAFITDAAAAKAHQGTFLGDFRVRQQRAACEHWPRAKLDKGFLEPLRSDIPTLVVSGERDPVTPARWGDEVARHLSNSRHMVMPDGAHGFFGLKNADCVDRLKAELFETGSVEDLDVEGCAASVERPAFAVALPNDEEIALASKELERYAATYGTAQGFELVVGLVGSRLQVSLGDETFNLIPVSRERFKVKGLPSGNYAVFQFKGDAVTGVEILRSGVSIFTMERKQ